jgi:CheY-like chemotaxis protein
MARLSVLKTTNPTLLLVEDSEDDAYFFQRTLRKSGLGFVVHHVTNGAEAVNFLRDALESKEPLPQVILLDLKMPVMNGFEVLEWMRTQVFPAEMRVIVLSGSDHQKDKDRAAQLGVNDYLMKPARIDDLKRFIMDICPAGPETGERV